MIEHNHMLFTSGDKSLFRKFEMDYGQMEDEQRLVYS